MRMLGDDRGPATHGCLPLSTQAFGRSDTETGRVEGEEGRREMVYTRPEAREEKERGSTYMAFEGERRI